jgi:hypothetical protein
MFATHPDAQGTHLAESLHLHPIQTPWGCESQITIQNAHIWTATYSVQMVRDINVIMSLLDSFLPIFFSFFTISLRVFMVNP